MKKVSNEYKKAMNQIIREQAYISVVLAEVNGIAQNDARFLTEGAYFSDTNTPFNTNEQVVYATFEENFTLADGKSKILPREGRGVVLDNGYTSEDILGSVTIQFGNTYSIKGLTINFGSGYPTEFRITTDIDSEGTVYENDSEEFVTTDTIGDISSLTITPITMVGGNQRLRIKRIIMGVGLSYNNEVVESADLSEEISDISEDIPDTQLKVSVLDMENKYNVNNTDSFIDYLTIGQLVTVSFGVALDEDSTEIEWLQTQTLYLSDWSAKNGKFTFSATNIFAQQNDNYTLGNRIYTRTAYDEAVSIFTDLGLEPDDYTIDNYLKSIELTNPMPEDTHANCLLLLCNACRCIFFQDGDGVIHIQGNFALNLEPEDITLTTVGETAYSTPRNVLTDGAVMTHYADFTSNFASADGSFKILPRDSADYVSDTGFVSQNIADNNGNFFDNIVQQATINSGSRYTQNGITWENKEDIIIANGSVSSGATYSNYWFGSQNHPIHLTKGKYYLSGCPKGGSWTTYRLSMIKRNNGTAQELAFRDYGDGVTFDLAEDTDIEMFMQIKSDVVAENLTFKPMLVKLDSEDSSVPTNYQYGNKPSLSMELEAGYVYYGLELNFSGQPPKEIEVDTSYNGGAVDHLVFTDLTANNYLYANFNLFDELTVTFTKGQPNSRINVDFVGLGNITDYRLDKDNMTSQLVGTREELVKDVQVKIYTYENDGDGNPQEVEDDVWYTETLNSTGSHKQISNPLISSNALAKDLAEWLGTHYKNNYSYEVDYRGDPRLNAADIIKLEDEYINNLQVSINKASLKFNGAFSGKLDMRRAMRE